MPSENPNVLATQEIKRVHVPGHQQNEGGAEIAADDAGQPADDDHRQRLDRNIDGKLFRRDRVIERADQDRAADATDER